jgi:hypothetical protein
MVTTVAASGGGSKSILRTSSKRSLHSQLGADGSIDYHAEVVRARCGRDRHRRRSERSVQFHCHPYIEFDVRYSAYRQKALVTDRFWRRVQLIAATHSANFSAGV